MKQEFYVSEDGIGNILEWFSLKLKLSDLTSGFRTTCADMEGGWEEIVRAGSWVGTRAGTRVTPRKQSEAEESAGNKDDEAVRRL